MIGAIIGDIADLASSSKTQAIIIFRYFTLIVVLQMTLSARWPLLMLSYAG